MNLDDVKDKALEKFQALAAKIRETESWVKLSEKFEGLSPRDQKLALGGGAAAFIGALLLVPYLLLSSSSDTIADFDENRALIRELFKVKHDSAILDNTVPALSGQDLQGRVQAQVNSLQLQPEQIRSVSDYDNQGPQASSIIPKGVIQKGATASLAKLTLKQAIDIGHKLQTIHPSAKLVGLEITANLDNPHYFDVVYKLVTFTVPAEPLPKGKAGKPGSKKFGNKPSAQ